MGKAISEATGEAISEGAFADRSALFSTIYRTEAPYVSRVVRRLGLPRDEIEDAVQDVFVVLHRRLDDIEDRALVRAWLHTASVRVCQNRRRAHARRARCWGETFSGLIDDVHDPIGRSPDEHAHSNETRNRILSVVERLSHKKREVFVLAEVERFTLLEIAQRFQISPNTAASRLRAARSEVRSRLSMLASQGSPRNGAVREQSANVVGLASRSGSG